jgi:hypothetical protein
VIVVCAHGLSGELRPDGAPRCALCRFELGDLQPTPTPPVHPFRCWKPGHEPYPRRGCPACAAEIAELRRPAHRPDLDALTRPKEVTHG